jgi:chemotaxis signal transduction protein
VSEKSKALSGLEQAQLRAQDSKRARNTVDSSLARNLAPFVLMRSRGQWYAVDAHQVQRVVAKGPITRVAGHPRHILGVTLVNDSLVPVVDLASLTGAAGAPAETEITPRLVVIGDQDSCVGVIAEEAQGIEELPQAMDGHQKGIIAGEKYWNDRHISYLDTRLLIATVNNQDEAK